MATFYGVEDLSKRAEYFLDTHRSETLRWIVVSDSERRLTEGLHSLQLTLYIFLSEAHQADKIPGFTLETIDLAEEPDAADEFDPLWERMKSKDEIYVPLFHHADDHPDLAQRIFDSNLRGVLTVSRERYHAIRNHSKRDTYNTAFIR